jgi:hypothetical protein
MKHFLKSTLFLCLLAIAIAIPAQNVLAQESGSILATATVVSTLSVIGINNLQFGVVTPGVLTSVNKNAAGIAGQWNVNGTAAAEVLLSFTVPDSLRTSDSSAAMQIIFNGTDAEYVNTGIGTQGTPTGILNPALVHILNLSNLGALTVWMGGTVAPTVAQTGGDYAAPIVLTVAYTGN